MAKTKTQIEDIAKIVGKTTKAFQDPPLIDAPSTSIRNLDGSVRQLPDPSKTLKPAEGIERINLDSIKLDDNLKGPNGEQVHQLSNEDPRLRFIGDWFIITGTNSVGLTPQATGTGRIVEVTFYGTGLNVLTYGDTNVRNMDVTVDGVFDSTINTQSSAVLSFRLYDKNTIYPAVSGLPLGVHTVKLEGDAGITLYHYGIEILNEEADIQVPEGEVLANGRRYTQSAATTTPHDSDFDGTPTLNGRGGRALIYKLPDDETVYKAIQQTDASQLNLSSADHSNEEVIRRINFREFGANRADDFSTLTTTSDRAFTLDDGTTTLVGNDVTVDNVSFSKEVIGPNAAGGFITITFVGTGLDLYLGGDDNLAYVAACNMAIDGVNIATALPCSTVAGRSNRDGEKILKIVSGLPYGTHTFKYTLNDLNVGIVISDFIIYGPKKPSIPADAQEISDYYLMADFVQGTQGILNVSTGVLRKPSLREMLFEGGWGFGSLNPPADINGFNINSNGSTPNSSISYTFYGTGFDFRFKGLTNGTNSNLVEVDGLSMNDTNYPSVTKSVYGAGISYNSATGDLDTQAGSTLSGCGFVIDGLPLGIHTVKITHNNNPNFLVTDGFDIITPIHFPNTKVGSLSMGNDVPVLQASKESAVDLGKAKAWISYEGITNTIQSSYNVAAVVDEAAGQFSVHFERPFKDAFYIVMGTGERYALGNAQQTTIHYDGNPSFPPGRQPNSCRILTPSNNGIPGDYDVTVAFFGELADEG